MVSLFGDLVKGSLEVVSLWGEVVLGERSVRGWWDWEEVVEVLEGEDAEDDILRVWFVGEMICTQGGDVCCPYARCVVPVVRSK